ncbi:MULTISPECIES: discoidin domain-containing protein [unclassified Breznakia]|uniref:discoidin domain-containing protein n=1 Tax=unclassified Breznakia TaxID=2623764 RepID=UPI002475D6DA|nr:MULTISPECIES: discoidin domain-containing protein [unclassified Breznakia]MDH6367612.1 hypothetical protein [Breznakia sp. PH1-1]MDH6403962.1 hypothetical protein [Breznakia sp. PF1-11]MDH6411671.1 hypothetical protein [Breznakia sp. PFB1-11]MDH6414741.1 hypothetical protein [Breznakia sp. PFB1-14]MDH6416022.1 hypothetical protein [Breznakia sp. PFB1-4]
MKIIKKSLVLGLLLSCIVSLFPQTEKTLNKAYSTTVSVTNESDKASIGNEYLTRNFKIEDGHVNTTDITNHRIDKALKPAAKSNDFEVNIISGGTVTEDVKPVNELSRTGWTASIAKSDGTSAKDAAALLDENDTTDIDYYVGNALPYVVTIDLKEQKEFKSFSLQKRQGNTNASWGVNGTVGAYEVQTSNDGTTWTAAGEGEFTKADYNIHQVGNLYNVGDLVYANFDTPQNARYVRLIQKSDVYGSQSFCMAEVRLYEDTYEKAVQEDSVIRSSNLTIDQVNVNEIQGGKELAFMYKPYNKDGVNWTFSYHVTMLDGDYFMRSFVRVNADDKDKARIDYIEMDHFVLDNTVEGVWSRPDSFYVADGAYNFLAPEMQLGQPIYADGMFFGSEFPATDTNIVKDTMKIRYYSGKSIAQLEAEGALSEGSYQTWPNVVGAAVGTDKNVVQTDFFAYIDTIATKTTFRTQYNSWYENRMGITDESIQRIFYASEKGLSQNGVEPLDSYVVDDGWNNYNDPTYTGIDAGRSGNSYNRTGFWEFNDKFPNELYPSMEMTKKFASTFGLWLGPQGGYELNKTFSEYLESQGTGYVNNNAALQKAIDVSSKNYVDLLERLFVDYQTRFDIDYWKLDGFASRPSTDEESEHMVGGDNNMYYTSELWERWIDVFETMRAQREAEGKGLFINATCYVNPSPWHLQWVNTVWQQNAGDLASDGTNGGTQSAKMISGRDNVYFVNGVDGDFQFPLKNVYNHDPIYGNAAGVKMNTEEFRDYMFANAMRGTAFWELYFSPDMMDDAKWKVTADILEFAEANEEILEKAKLFGSSPKSKQGIYGYSSWNGSQGIVYFRNPTASEKEYTFTYDGNAGVATDVQNVKQTQIYPYKNKADNETISYGDSVTIKLAPYEMVAYQYGIQDDQAPTIEVVRNTDEKTLDIRFSERISDELNVTIKGTDVSSITLLEDYRTARVVCDSALANTNEVKVTYVDIAGNASSDMLEVNAYENHVVAALTSASDLKDDTDVEHAKLSRADIPMFGLNNKGYELKDTNTFDGVGEFGLSFVLKTASKNAVLYNQDGLTVAIDEEGYIVTTINGETLSSKELITEVVELEHGLVGSAEYVPTTTTTKYVGQVADDAIHTVVVSRELNGLCKVYVDGNLHNSIYLPDTTLPTNPNTKVSVGSNEFSGYIGNLTFKNVSVGYDEAQNQYTGLLLEGTEELDRSDWIATASSEYGKSQTEGPAKLAIDGSTSTLWHSNWASAYPEPRDHWIAFDFGKEQTFDSLEYTGRAAKTNGNMKDYLIQIKDDQGNWTDLKTGTIDDGGAQMIYFDDVVSTTGIRIKVLSDYGPEAKHAAAVEIRLLKGIEPIGDYNAFRDFVANESLEDPEYFTADSYKDYKDAYDALMDASRILDIDDATIANVTDAYTTAKDALVRVKLDPTKLADAIAKAEKIDQSKYTTESANALQTALDAAKKTLSEADKQSQLDSATANLQATIDALVKLGDKADLQVLVDIVDVLDASEYTEETWNVVADTLAKAKVVLANDQALQADVDTAYDALLDAVSKLTSTVEVAKDELQDLVEDSSKLKEADYTKDTWNVFVDALEKAKTVLEDPNATAGDVLQAKVELTNAINQLKESSKELPSVTPETPDKPADGTDTGDTTNVNLLLMLLALSALGIGVGYTRKMKKK